MASSSVRIANLTNDKAVKALRWREGDPIQFAIKDKSNRGYYIRLSKGGTKTWFYQYKFKGRLRRKWFGRYPGVSCADAFIEYDRSRKLVDAGVDIIAVSEDEKAIIAEAQERNAFTLSVLFREHFFPRYSKPKKRSWKNDWVYFTTKIEPVLGARPAAEVSPDDIEMLVRPIELAGYNTARLTLAVLRKMYNWASSPSSSENPGTGALLSVINPCLLYKLDATNAPEPVTRALNDGEIRDLWQSLGSSNSDKIIKLQLLTGCRVGECAGIRETEIDREASEWNIPASRSKTKRPLNVPLTHRMLEIIGPQSEGFLFPSKSKLEHTTTSGAYQSLKRHCRTLGIEDVGTHTMRRTFITNMARLGVPIEIRNRLTNHKDSSVDGIYNLHDYFSERLNALMKWDKKLESILSRVSSIKS